MPVTRTTHCDTDDVTSTAFTPTESATIAAPGPITWQKADACVQPTTRRSVNFHSIADLVGERRSPELHDCSAPPASVCSALSGLGQPGLLTVPLTIVTSALPNDLVMPTTPPGQKEVPTRPSSTGTCSSANTSLTGSTENSPTSDEADESITPLRKGQSSKKGRTIYKAQQVVVLEQVFSRTHYPDADFVERLAHDLAISEGKIKVWFQNKRARWRRRQARGACADDTGSPPTSAQAYPASQPLAMMAADLHPLSDLRMGAFPASPHLQTAHQTALPSMYMPPTAQLSAHAPPSLTSYPAPGHLIPSLQRPELYMPPGGYVAHYGSPMGHMTPNHVAYHLGGTLLAN